MRFPLLSAGATWLEKSCRTLSHRGPCVLSIRCYLLYYRLWFAFLESLEISSLSTISLLLTASRQICTMFSGRGEGGGGGGCSRRFDTFDSCVNEPHVMFDIFLETTQRVAERAIFISLHPLEPDSSKSTSCNNKLLFHAVASHHPYYLYFSGRNDCNYALR